MAFSGNWKLDRMEGMADIAKAMGLPESMMPSSPVGFTLEITQNGDNFEIKTTTPQGTRASTFTVGGSLKEQIMGVEVDCTSKWDGGKLVVETGKGNSLTREIVGGELVATVTFENASGKRIFKKC
ncbi:fatty acid-binding protein 10-A, liver basic-like [Amphiura filiformis]|uniref:fatty acid-binding protein 10-A, liver basic-like n=1 Tax=Amphiura filiformis TaxID=82378 RepID=UPI003B212FA7